MKTDFYWDYHETLEQYASSLVGKSVSAEGSSNAEIRSRLERKEKAVITELYRRCEAIADRYADGLLPRYFPDLSYEIFSSTSEKTGKTTIWSLNYFDDMSAEFSGDLSRCQTRVGRFLYQAGKLSRDSGKKSSFGGGLLTYCVFMTVLLLFAAGDTAALLLNGPYGFWARAALGVVMTIGSYAMSGQVNEYRGALTRTFGMTLFLLIVASFLVGASMTVAYPDPFDALYVLPFAGYHAVMALMLVLDGIIGIGKAAKTRASAQKEFRELMAREREHCANYIRFHEAWWQEKGEGKKEPAGLARLRLDFGRYDKWYSEMK